MGQPATGKEFEAADGPVTVAEVEQGLGATADPEVIAPAPEQAADTPGSDENGDGLKGGQATADVPGDVLGI